MAAAPTSAHSAQHSHALPSVAAYYARAHRRQLESRAVVHALSFNSTATHLAAATDLNALTILSLSDALSDSSTSPRLAVHPFPSDALPTALLCATNSLYVATTSHCLHANWHALSQPHSSETPALIPIPGADDVIALAPLADGATLAASRRGPLLRLDSAARAQVAVASSSSEPTFDLVASPIDRHMIYKTTSSRKLFQLDLRRGHAPVSTLFSPGVNARLAFNDDGTFLAAAAGTRLSILHVGSDTAVAEVTLPFSARAVTHVGGAFYCAGIPTRSDEAVSLLAFDVMGRRKATPPVSATSVLALAVGCPDMSGRTHGNGRLAAAGFTPSDRLTEAQSQIVDIYVHPPMRSLSLPL